MFNQAVSSGSCGQRAVLPYSLSGLGDLLVGKKKNLRISHFKLPTRKKAFFFYHKDTYSFRTVY